MFIWLINARHKLILEKVCLNIGISHQNRINCYTHVFRLLQSRLWTYLSYIKLWYDSRNCIFNVLNNLVKIIVSKNAFFIQIYCGIIRRKRCDTETSLDHLTKLFVPVRLRYRSIEAAITGFLRAWAWVRAWVTPVYARLPARATLQGCAHIYIMFNNIY